MPNSLIELPPKMRASAMNRSGLSRIRRVRGVFAGLALFVACLCGCKSGTISDLQAADVPVRPLEHVTGDPCSRFPEKFPMQVAVYWSKADESVLEVEHALGQMGIPFFITRDLNQALRHNLVMAYPSVDGRTFTDAQIGQI